MVFTGTYEHSIDAKNRLAIPSEVRALVQGHDAARAGVSGQWYVTLGEGQALCLYTQQAFEQRARELDESELDAEQLLTYERLMFSLARLVETDAQGRVRLPDQLLKMSGLTGDVVLLGVKDHLEIRDREAWYRHVQDVLAQQPQLLMNPRRLMRRNSGQG